jgi:hydroxyacylglutathione hydrolase
MQIHPVPNQDDNYSYIIIDAKHPKKAVFVDPFDVPACQSAADKLGIEEVVGNITTHHHQDHSGGNEEFAQKYPKAVVYGGSNKIPALNKMVKDGDNFPLFEGSSIKVTTKHTPCHTQDSTAFFLEDENQSVTEGKNYARGVFTGDTLFISGCGRFFEGECTGLFFVCHFSPN